MFSIRDLNALERTSESLHKDNALHLVCGTSPKKR